MEESKMSQSVDASQAEVKHKSSSFLGKAVSEVADFGEGLYHGAIENPINGASQLANHLVGSHLPELHLVDQDRLSHSAGGVLGTIAGTALDFYAVSVATAGVADLVGAGVVGAEAAGAATVGTEAVTTASVLGTALRVGAVGAAYTAVLQPTDAKSDHFFQDRLTNGAVAFGTFAAMGGAAGALNNTGLFAISSARTLGGNLLYGGLTGTAGGIVHAEANAVIKQGKALPSLAELATDAGTYAAFGMAYGAANFAYNRATLPEAKTYTSGEHSATVQTDSQGNPIKVNAVVPAVGDPDTKVGFEGFKMTDGHWSTKAWEQYGNSRILEAVAPSINDVKIDDNQVTMLGNGVVRQFTDGGEYKRTDLDAVARQDAYDAEYAKYHKSAEVDGVITNRAYDDQMRVTQLDTRSLADPRHLQNNAYISYKDDGSISSLSVGQEGQRTISASRQADGSWSVSTDNAVFRWNGDIKVVPGAESDHPEQVQFTPAQGGAASFNVNEGIKPVADMMHSTATYVPGGTGRPVVSVDAGGNASITGSTAGWQREIVNGHQLAAGETLPIKPGDAIQMKMDVGDRYPIWELRNVIWGTGADGTPVLGTSALKPGTTLDFDANAGGTKVVEPQQ